MEHLVDLDVLADRLRPLIEEWERSASVGPLTWLDETATWPRPVTSDRSIVQIPESVGFTIHKRTRDEAFEMVVWTGGWADVGYIRDGDIHHACPEFGDVDGAYDAVVKEVDDFLADPP